jgi:hypothetical protein
MTPFTIADIPKNPPVIKDSLTTEPGGIPQAAAPAGGMLEMFGENPWDVEARDAAEAEAKRQRDAQAKIDGVALDPVSYFKDKDMGYTRDPEKTQRMAINSAYMELASGDQPVPMGESDLQRRLVRQDIAIRRFGGRGADSEDGFHAEVVKEAQGRKDGKAMGADLAKTASAAAFMNREDLGETNASGSQRTFRNWKEEAMKKPGYDPASEADYFEAWHQVQGQVKAAVDPFRSELDEVWKAFSSKGDFAAEAQKAYYTLPDKQHDAFMVALSLRARALPEAEQATFWENLKKQTGRDVGGYGQNVLDAVEMFTAGTAAMNAPEPAIIAQAGMERQAIDFRADVTRIQQSEYDPMKYLAKDGTWSQIFEKGAYGAPGAIATSLSAGIPVVGMASFYLSSQESLYQQYRQDYQAKGMSYEKAASMATDLAPIAAVPQVLMEKLQLNALHGKLPVLDKVLNGMLDKVTSRLARFGLRTVVGAVEEGSLEQLQDLVPAAVQDIGHALEQDIPDVQWTGKGGVLDGYWTKNAEMIVTMLPLAIFGGAGGISADRRTAAFSAASTTELQALGINADGIAAINAARGQASLSAAVDHAMETRDATTPEAAAAVETLKTQYETTRQARADLERLGYAAPTFVHSAMGVTVFDGEGQELGTAPDIGGAVRIAGAHTTALENMERDQVGALGSLFEATAAAMKLDTATTFDVSLGEFDPSRATPGQAARYAAQVALQEQAEGGTGDVARSVLGYSVTGFAQGMRNTVNNLFKGASIPTVFHETFHGLRRGAHEAGTITPAMEISLLMNHDKSLGDRRVRDAQGKQSGADLRFIPAGITAEMMNTGDIPAAMIPAAFQGDGKRYAETLLDEGISEIAEVEVMNLRKGQGKGKLGITRELVSRNLTSLAKLQPGVAGSWKAFFSAVRAHWGLATSRAVVLMRAEKKGEFDPTERKNYLNKLLGLDAQEEHDAGVKDEFSRMMAGFDDAEVDDIPFSIGRISDHLKTSFASPVEDYTFAPADENRPRILEIAERYGIEIVKFSDPNRREDLHGDTRGAARAFQETQGVEIVYYQGGKSEVLGFSPLGNPELVFINTAPAVKGIPVACTLSHEMVHSYQKDKSKNAADLWDKLKEIISSEDLELSKEALVQLGYPESSFETEIPAFLAGDAISGYSQFGLDDFENADAIRDAIAAFFDELKPLNASGLKDASDADLFSLSLGPAQVAGLVDTKALTGTAFNTAALSELKASLAGVTVAVTTNVAGENASAEYQTTGKDLVAKLRTQKSAYEMLLDCLGKKITT